MCVCVCVCVGVGVGGEQGEVSARASSWPAGNLGGGTAPPLGLPRGPPRCGMVRRARSKMTYREREQRWVSLERLFIGVACAGLHVCVRVCVCVCVCVRVSVWVCV